MTDAAIHGFRPRFQRDSYDVIIVGARCAGAATAMLLARAGVRVLAIDRQAYGSDTLSTHALMRPAVVQLARWGLLREIVAAGTPVVDATSFHYGADDVVTVPIRPTTAVPGLVAPRRTVLDRVLVDAARRAGAEVVHDVFVQNLIQDHAGRAIGVAVKAADGTVAKLKAPLIVGADGRTSAIARQVRAATVHRGEVSATTIYCHGPDPGKNGYHWYFGDGAAAGAIPTNDGNACVFSALPTDEFDASAGLDLASRHRTILWKIAPEIAPHVASSSFSPCRAFRGAPAFVRQAHGPGWILVGDAGLFRDPLTSHGISDAFRDAEGAAEAILGGSQYDFRAYQEERDALALPVIEATEAISAFNWSFDELKSHHKQLSAAMKAETDALNERCSRASMLPRTDRATLRV